MTNSQETRVALVTGGTAGLGLALTGALATRGWRVLTDGRHKQGSHEAGLLAGVTAIRGDITDPRHRDELRGAVESFGRLDLVVHNASTLGPLPMRHLAEVGVEDARQVWATNVAAPLALTGNLLPWLSANQGLLISLSSDAALEHYPTWGLYGASKAALDHVILTYAAETGLTAYAVDPGDMRTQMHADAFPGEDIDDRPLPETVVPALLRLIEQRPESGRYRAEAL